MTDKHHLRIEIFNSTLAVLRQGWYLAPDKHRVLLPAVQEVMDAATMYSEPFKVPGAGPAPVATEVRVEDKDCVLAAIELIDAGYLVAPDAETVELTTKGFDAIQGGTYRLLAD